MTSSRPSSSAIEAERNLNGAKFIDPNTLADLDIEIAAKGLFNKYHQRIWNAWLALELASTAIDKVTSHNLLANNGKLKEIGGDADIACLIRYYPTSAHARDYAHIAKENAQRGQFSGASYRLIQAGQNEAIEKIFQGIIGYLRAPPTDKKHLLVFLKTPFPGRT